MDETIENEVVPFPDKLELNDVLEKIDQLKEGQTVHITHSFAISKIGGLNIAVDVVTEGDVKPWGTILPPPGDETLKSTKFERQTQTEIIHSRADFLNDQLKSNSQRVGEALGSRVDAVVISHLDPDHMDFETMRAMMNTNENLQVYGPLGWQSHIAKAHGLNKDSDNFDYLPENIKKRLHGLSPKPTNPSREKGLTFEGALNLSEVVVEKNGKKAKIISFEVPHIGSKAAEYSQGFVLEAGDKKIMHIADAGLTPELLRQVSEFHDSDKPMSQIFVSTAAYNLSQPYPVSAEKWKLIRDVMREEAYAHSNYLPVALAAVTEGKTPIFLTHHGTYYDSQRVKIEEGGLNQRLPFSKEQKKEKSAWLSELKNFIHDTTKSMQDSLNESSPLSGSTSSTGRTTKTELTKSIYTHFKFTKQLTDWINNSKIPEEVGSIFKFPAANSIN